MTKTTYKYVIGKTESKTFVAARGESPYFCFEGATLEEVDRQAKAALRFYSTLGPDKLEVPPTVRGPILSRVRRVKVEEHAA